ncbi:MAG TPA: hypothetical protein VLG68_09015 [Gammaproteobacteria bacterium]|nr:hypothetical protein [Gammaproteobacteria bacterium]
MRLALILPVSFAALVVGCGGAAPKPAPYVETGALRGRIEQGTYHDKRGWFQVGTPFHEDEPQFPYLKIREEYPENVSFVNFTLLSNPGENYVAYVEDLIAGHHTEGDLDQMLDAAVRFFGKQVTDIRLEPMQLVKEEAWQTGSSHGIIRFYTETASSTQAMAPYGMLDMGEDYTAYIVLYITVKAGKVAVLWTEWPHDCKVCAATPKVDGAVATDDPIAAVLAGNARAASFIASLRYTDTGETTGASRSQ